jgi:hypothetical protein
VVSFTSAPLGCFLPAPIPNVASSTPEPAALPARTPQGLPSSPLPLSYSLLPLLSFSTCCFLPFCSTRLLLTLTYSNSYSLLSTALLQLPSHSTWCFLPSPFPPPASSLPAPLGSFLSIFPHFDSTIGSFLPTPAQLCCFLSTSTTLCYFLPTPTPVSCFLSTPTPLSCFLPTPNQVASSQVLYFTRLFHLRSSCTRLPPLNCTPIFYKLFPPPLLYPSELSPTRAYSPYAWLPSNSCPTIG